MRRLGSRTVSATLAAAALALTSGAVQAESDKTARFQMGTPEGFDSLTGPQKGLVDVYFSGRKVGQATVVWLPGSLRFENPDRVLELLPALTDATTVRAALAAGELDTNAGRVCTRGANPAECGRLAPQVAGVIFDEAHFRVDVFINPRLLQISQATTVDYLPRPQSGASVLNALSAVMSGSTRSRTFYNLQNRLMIGDADRRLRADVAYSTGFGVQADQIVAEIDRPGWRFSGGAFWTQGSSLIGRRKILGVGAQTQFDTRLDKDEMRGTPLMVFLNQRAKVDIVRDGRVIASRVYEGGNQAIDTSGMPDGAYEVVLRIEEAGGATREERRFFTRNRQIAPMGHAVYYAYAGVLVDDFSQKLLSPTKTPFMQLGGGWRINPHLALDANVMATDKAMVGELGATWISRAAQLRLGGVISTTGTRGGFFHASSSGNGRLNFDFDLRHIRMGGETLPGQGPPGNAPPGGDPFAGRDLARLPIARKTFTQLAGSLNYSLPRGQFGVSAAWRRERGEAATYSVGPWLRYSLLNRGPWNLAFQGDYSVSREGKAGFVGLSLRFQGTRLAITSDAGLRSRGNTGSPSRNGVVASLNAGWNRDNPDGTDIELAAGYDRDLDRQLVNGHAVLRNRQAQLSGDVIHGLGNGGGGTQYSLGVQTTLALRGSNIALVGKNRNDSMLMVSVKGGDKQSRFEVLVDDMSAGTLPGGGSLSVALSPYRQYDVRIRPLGTSILHYDGTAKRIGLYPGNVARLDWSVNRLVALFGRLVLPDGSPVRGAYIRAEGGIGQSDDNGFFQIEAAEGASLEVALNDGRSCTVQQGAANRDEAFVKLGTVICRASSPNSGFTTALREPAGPTGAQNP